MAKSQKINQLKKQTAVNNTNFPSFNYSAFEEKISLALLICLLIFVYIIRSKFSTIPFERDEGIYSYFGKLVLEGKTPYLDFYEVKFPGIFYFYAFIVSVFGDTVKAMHMGFMLINLASIFFVYYASKLLFTPIAGLISAITFAFLSLNPGLSGFTVQSEHGVAFFTSIGLLFYGLAIKHNKWQWYGLMGLAMGCAFMVKTSGVMFCLWGAVIILSDFIFTTPKNYKNFLTNALAYSIGGISIVALLFLIIIKKGAFDEMYYWTYEHSKQYIGNVSLEEGLKYLGYTRNAILENYKLFWFHSILAIILCWAKSIDIKLKLFGITLLLFSFLSVVPGFYFYGHYFIQVVPGFAVVAGLTVYSVISISKKYFKEKSNLLPYIYLAVFSMLTYAHVNALKAYYLKPNYDKILRAVYGNNPFPEDMEIAKFINANSKPEDNIVLIGSEPQVYFYTKKKCPSRHAYFTALVNNVPKHKAWQSEFISDVEKAKPRYFIFYNHPISLLVQQGADTYVFDWANKYINEHYQLVGLVDMIDGPRSLYKWNQEALTYKPTSQYFIYIFERKK
jgi:hypothetical protein